MCQRGRKLHLESRCNSQAGVSLHSSVKRTANVLELLWATDPFNHPTKAFTLPRKMHTAHTFYNVRLFKDSKETVAHSFML